jgi:hypothetical protein
VGGEYSLRLELNDTVLAVKGVVVWSVLSEIQKGREDETKPFYSAGMKFKDILSQRLMELLEFIDQHKIVQENRLGGLRFHIDAPGKALLDVPQSYRVRVISLSGLLMEDRPAAGPAPRLPDGGHARERGRAALHGPRRLLRGARGGRAEAVRDRRGLRRHAARGPGPPGQVHRDPFPKAQADMIKRSLSLAAALAVAALASAAPPPKRAPESELPSPERLAAVRDYIKKSWTTLSRSLRDLPAAARDPKLHLAEGTPWPVYIPPREDQAAIEAELKRQLSPADFATIAVRPLPPAVDMIREHGLLYLPRPYVVPGGRFNEMYGWDSYFIQVGLLRDGEIAAARDMADNFIYEIENYGTLLNANRTYYLTRSQPPFLTRMILGVYEKEHDRAWLRSTLPAVEKYYRFWTSDPHLDKSTGLSRYYDTGEGPAPEVESDEKDAAGLSHYDRAREYYKTHEVPDYDVTRFYDKKADALTGLFYKGDRSMRESGFDPSSRYGPFSVDIVHYAPVCLNVLLYQMEKDGGEIARALGDPAVAITWEGRARAAAAAHRPVPVGREGGALPRLQLRDRQAPPLRVRHHVLSAVGGRGVQGAGGPRWPRTWRSSRRRAASSPARRPPATSGTRPSAGRPCSSSPWKGCAGTATRPTPTASPASSSPS